MNDNPLRKAGLKVTAPRVKIFQMLQDAKGRHLSAEDIFQSLHNADTEVALATIYRVLTQFEEAGLIHRHNFESGHSVFEIDEGEHHDHLVCMKCGYVEEFCDPTIEERQQIIAEEANFKMTDHNLTIYGLCSSCIPAAATS